MRACKDIYKGDSTVSIYITIDGGTTNTRVTLVKNEKITDTIKLNIGARAGIDDKTLLKTELKKAICTILKEHELCEKDIVCIIASGMITSEFGLCNLEHIKAPAGINELHDSMEKMQISEIAEIPFVFIRGVKMQADDFEKTDMMRGEETELMGMINPAYGNCVYILPGSHSKIIKVDETGRICDFSTMLTGEMIAALSGNTILKDAVDLSVSDINSEYLLKGYDFCKQEGINKALFKVRILKNIFKCNKTETYSFFIGIILCGEIEKITECNAETVVIGGKSQIKKAITEILKNRDNKKIISLDENAAEVSTTLGAVKIFEKI